MALSDYTIVTPFGGATPSHSVVDQDTIRYDGSLFEPKHPILENGGDFLRLGPNVNNAADSTLYLTDSIPVGSDEAVDTSMIVSGNWRYLYAQCYLIQRWAGGTSSEGIRLGFQEPNILSFDINRVTDGGMLGYSTNPATHALFIYLTGMTAEMFHGIRLSTRTVARDTYTTIYAHFNLTDLNDLTWTKLFTVLHMYGSNDALIAQHYTGSPITSIHVGYMGGLTVPRLAGFSGFGTGTVSTGQLGRSVYVGRFQAMLG